MNKIPFKIEQLKAGDTITMPRLDRKEEAQRWLIVDVAHDLGRVIVLLDSGNRNDWLGKLLSFAKCEIDTDKWRKIA